MVRSFSAVLSAENYVGFYVEVDRDTVRFSVTVAESDVLRGYVLFEVGSTGQWERRVADWIANCCCMLKEVRPIGVSCTGMPSLRGLMEGENGSGSVLLDPVRLGSVMRVVTSAGMSVFPGQDVHVVMNFLLIKLRELLTLTGLGPEAHSQSHSRLPSIDPRKSDGSNLGGLSSSRVSKSKFLGFSICSPSFLFYFGVVSGA